MEPTDFLVRGVDLRLAWDAIVAGRLTPDDRVLAEPRYGTKGNLTAHSGVMELELLPSGSDESLCLLRRLGRYATAMADAGWPLADFLFRPLAAGRPAGFRAHGMSSAAMNFRFKGHLRAAVLYKGHTLHGVKRGRLQHDVVVEDESVTQASHGRHRHVRTTLRYVHPARHRDRLV